MPTFRILCHNKNQKKYTAFLKVINDKEVYNTHMLVIFTKKNTIAHKNNEH